MNFVSVKWRLILVVLLVLPVSIGLLAAEAWACQWIYVWWLGFYICV